MANIPPGTDRTAEKLTVRLPARMSVSVVFSILAALIGATAGWMWWFNPTYALVPAGIALTVASIAALMQSPRFTALEGDLQTGQLSLRVDGGEVARLPSNSIATAEVTKRTSSDGSTGSATYGARLQKKDGGFIHLCDVGYEDDAKALVARISKLLDSVRVSTEGDSILAEDARRRLDRSPLVEVEQLSPSRSGYRGSGDEELVLRWSLKPGRHFIVTLPVAVGGVVSAILSGIFADRFGLPHAALVLVGLFFLAALVRMRDAHKTQEVRAGGDELVLATRRGAKSLAEERLPFAAINAVDVVSHSGLMLRIDEAHRELTTIREGEEAVDRKGSAFPMGAMLGAVMALARQTIMIDTGTLPLQLRIDLETVLDAEIAARSGRVAAQI